MTPITAASIRQALGQKLMLAFYGQDELPAEARQALEHIRPGGFTLFRNANLRSPAQVRSLTANLQSAARQAGLPPLLIAADQEGGQLLAVGEGATPFPGNLALGAAGSEDLARRTGQAVGLELAAMGINTNFAPLLDVLPGPSNTRIGARSFGQDPTLAARLGAAYVEGLQSAGVAATARHFPGLGDTAAPGGRGIASIAHGLDHFEQVEFPPFRAAIQAGVRLVMAGHIAAPGLNNGGSQPLTHSPEIIAGLLRGSLGFDGLVVTDALDMQSTHAGAALPAGIAAAFAAGVDLMLLGPDADRHPELFAALLAAGGLPDDARLLDSARRVEALKTWLGRQEQPSLDVVGCDAHQALALETARRSITLVRDQTGLLPLRLEPGQRILLLTPQPSDLTPAETSSHTILRLHHEVRRRHPATDWLLVPPNPTFTEITAILERAEGHALVIACTFNAVDLPGQAQLVKALLKGGISTLTVAMRTPYDLLAFPSAPAYLCTYGIQPPTQQALVEAIFGEIPFQGSLPVHIPGV